MKLLSTTAILVFVAWASPAAANDDATAEALFLQARAAMSQGDNAKACPMLEESYRLLPGAGTRFNLADCWEKLGKTASAWAAFRDVAAASKLAGQTDRESAARARVSALEPKLCRASIHVAPQADVTLTRDGKLVGSGQWGADLPIDPGPHTVKARAPGKTAWTSTFEIKDCPADTRVDVPVLKAASNAVAAAAPAAPTAHPVRPRTIGTVATIGVGLAAFGVGTYFGARAWSLRDDSNDGHCDGNRCDDIGRGLRDDSLTAGSRSTALFVTGGALLAIGALLWLTDGGPKPTTAARLP
jgi:hypothetical protein